MKQLHKYRYAFIISIYAIIYMLIFQYLEQRTNVTYHIIHTSLDDKIPFCEYFIIPYYLWFAYMVSVVFYFVIINRSPIDCRRLLITLCSGMSIFLIVSFIYPNGLDLRPSFFVRDNIFTHLVSKLYRIDTPTNVLPSIHVFNSVTIYLAIANCERLQQYKVFRFTALLLTILIVLSTMFLKQHSVIDVSIALLLCYALYSLVYRKAAITELESVKQL